MPVYLGTNNNSKVMLGTNQVGRIYLGTNLVKSWYLLDYVSDVIGAWALTKLSSSYTGNCVEVRRSSDDTAANIGFSGLSLNMGALSSHVSTNDGFVRTWYDQSGNTRNLVQTTNGNQPQLVDDGTMYSYGLLSATSNCSLAGGDWDSNTIGIAARVRPTSINNEDRYFVQKNGYDGWAVGPYNDGTNKWRFTINNGGYRDLDNTTIATNTTYRVIADYSGTTQRLRANGDETTNSTSGNLVQNNGNVVMGKTGYSANYPGYIDFLLLKNGAFTSGEISAIEAYLGG